MKTKDMTTRDMTTSEKSRPLLVSDDDSLIDELLRLAAAAGVTPETARTPAVALRYWQQAGLVLVGADVAEELAAVRPERRPAVHVIAQGRVPDDIFRLALRLGARDVAELPQSESWVVEMLTDLGDDGGAGGQVIGVVSGSGGAGATTLACALAQSASRSREAVVIDCDPLGAGVDRVLGLEGRDGFRWDALCQTTGRLSARALRDALPRRGRLRALTWYAGAPGQLQAFAAREAVSAARRGHDLVVLDLPRPRDALIEELVTRCDSVLVVVVPSVVGVSSAARLCERLSEATQPQLVVRGAGVPESDIAQVCHAPVVCSMTDQRGLAESIDLGLGPLRSDHGRLAKACGELLAGPMHGTGLVA